MGGKGNNMLFPYVVIEMLHLHKSKPAVPIKFLTYVDLLPLLRKEKQNTSQDSVDFELGYEWLGLAYVHCNIF